MIYTNAEGNNFIKYSSDETDKILIALSQSQQDFLPLKKSGHNPHYKSKYSTLSDIFESCMPSLKKRNLSIHSCLCRINTKNFFVQTIIHTESGQFLSSSADMGTYEAIQTVGSKITYLRRYLLQPMLNLEGDIETDDDGNAGQKADKPNVNHLIYIDFKGNEVHPTDIVLWSKELRGLVDYIQKNNGRGTPRLRKYAECFSFAEQLLKKEPNEIIQQNINLAREILND